VCFDEFGPLELRPHFGRTWAQRKHPHRLPATYTRPHGVRHFLAFFDVHRDILWGYFAPRKRWMEVLQALKRMRAKYPRSVTIFLILDNFSPHRRPEIRRWAKANKVVLVWTPTNASWLNRIECQFTELKKYAIDDVFYTTHRALQHAVHKFLKYRNNRNKASPKHKKNNLKRH
jgi:transposase